MLSRNCVRLKKMVMPLYSLPMTKSRKYTPASLSRGISKRQEPLPSASSPSSRRISDVIVEGVEFVDVVGTSKGKGFQGVVKRHGFAGVGGQTHGQHNRLRHPGSMGASSWPSRVFPGMRMAGHMGNERVKVFNLKVVKVIPENNLLVVKGSVPGAKGSYVILEA